MDDGLEIDLMPDPLIVRIHRYSYLLYCLIALLVFVSDQVTKTLVERSIPLYSTVPVIPHFFNLTHTHNPGAAFGLFSQSPSPWKTAVLIAISLVLLITVLAMVWKSRRVQWEAGVALALIIGGAASNLLDRIRYGRVTDFLDFYIRDYHWFTFNLADSAIVVGAFLLVIHLLTSE
ncbi:MAG TPA: signal peptidase II [Terriglobia bacterium]|nr:signal peptidase II [Terriglobia bacterium]